MSSPKATLERLPRAMQVVLAVGAIALAAFPLIPLEASDFYLQMLTQMMILAIFAMSLDLLQGVTGLVSLGHAAYFGLAGYALAFLTPADTPISLWWSLPLAAAGAGLAALVIGFFVVRTHGIYFIMVTMAFAQMVFFLFFDNKALGGSDGIYVNFRPDATALGIDLENKCWLLLGKYNLKMLILTCGVNGSYVFTPGEVSFIETPKVEVADTVGAGDSFTGAFVASILKGKSVKEAHELAVKVSAFVCTQNGAMPVLPKEFTR